MQWIDLLLVLAVALLLGLGILKLCTKWIPNKPPHVGLETIWGERKERYKKEGWRFFAPFFPFYYDFIPIKIEKVNQDLEPKKVFSLERAELTIQVSLVWSPDCERLISFLNSGGENGISDILDDVVEEELRQSAAKKGWEKAVATPREAAEDLRKQLIGNIRVDRSGSPDNGDLGILIHRLNVDSIQVGGELARVAEQVAVEERQREAELVEIQTEAKQAQALVDAAREAGEEMSFDRALDLNRQYKYMRETKKGFIIPGLPDALKVALETIFRRQ